MQKRLLSFVNIIASIRHRNGFFNLSNLTVTFRFFSSQILSTIPQPWHTLPTCPYATTSSLPCGRGGMRAFLDKGDAPFRPQLFGPKGWSSHQRGRTLYTRRDPHDQARYEGERCWSNTRRLGSRWCLQPAIRAKCIWKERSGDAGIPWSSNRWGRRSAVKAD
jgi:hypothetical protein